MALFLPTASLHAAEPPEDQPEIIKTADQLRSLFNRAGLQQLEINAALSKMTAAQLAELVHSVADAQLIAPPYAYSQEISIACEAWALAEPDAALKFVLASKQRSFRQTALYGIIPALSRARPGIMPDLIRNLDDPQAKEAAESAWLLELGRNEPDKFLAVIKADPKWAAMRRAESFAASWALDDPAAAAARTGTFPVDVQKGPTAVIGRIWGAKDRKAALAWAKTLDPTLQTEAVAAIAGGTAVRNPEAAFASLPELDPLVRRAALVEIFRTLADTQPETALTRAAALRDAADQRAVLHALLSTGTWIGGGPEPLKTVIGQLKGGKLRDEALNALGSYYFNRTTDELEQALVAYPGKEFKRLRSQLLHSLANADPLRAARIYEQSPPGSWDPNTDFNEIIAGLAKKDVAAAIKFSLAAPTAEAREQGLRSTAAYASFQDPAGMAAHLTDFPEGAPRENALTTLASDWAHNDPDAAKQWANDLPEPAKRTAALIAMARELYQNDPSEGLTLLSALAAANSKDPALVVKITQPISYILTDWEKEDAPAAGNWILTLPEGRTQEIPMNDLAYNWCKRDPKGMSQWTAALPAGPAHDLAMHALEHGVYQSVARLKQSDPAAARAMIDSVELPDFERQRLLKNLEPDPKH